MDVGIVGLGAMGLPIAANLLASGFTVTGYCRSGSPDLEAAGGRQARSAREVAAVSDVVITILPGADTVEAVLLGPGGLLEGLRPGAVVVEMSTIDVDRKIALRDAVVAAGGEMLDAPISGGPMMVAPRQAVLFASGAPDVVERTRPVLEAVAGPCNYTGAFGTGGRTKHLANLLLAVNLAGAAEALALARAWDLDLEALQANLDSSIAASAIAKQRAPMMRTRTYLPAPGPVATLGEVLDQVAAAARRTQTRTPVFAAAKALFDAAADRGWSHLDVAVVHELAAGRDPLAET